MNAGRLRGLTAGMLGAAGMIAVLTLASRLAGFLRWLVQAWAVGAGATGTAYASANTVPNVLYEIVAGGALAGAVVPLIAAPLAHHLRGQVHQVSSALVTWVVLALAPVAVLVLLLAHPLAVALVGPGEMTQVTATFLRIFALQIPLYGLGVVLTGILQAHKRFFWPAFAPLLSTAVVILAYAAFGALTAWTSPAPRDLSTAAIMWLAWGTTAGVAAMSLPLLVPVLRSGTTLRPVLRFPDGVAAKARRLALAGLGTVLAQQVAVVVILQAANRYGPPGTYPIYQYANAVYALPYAVLVVPLATAVFPRISAVLAQEDHHRAGTLTASTTRISVWAGALGVALLAALAPTATQIFELRGPMPGMTAAITALSPGVLGFGLMFHLTRVLYALHAGGAAVRGAGAGWLLTAVLAATLPGVMPGDARTSTLLGVGVATSLGMSLAAVLLMLSVRRVMGGGAQAGVVRSLLLALSGGALGALLARPAVTGILTGLPGLGGALLGALLGAGICLAVMAALAWFTDRSALRAARAATPSALDEEN